MSSEQRKLQRIRAGYLPGLNDDEVQWQTLDFKSRDGQVLEVCVPVLTAPQMQALACRVRTAAAIHLRPMPVAEIIDAVDHRERLGEPDRGAVELRSEHCVHHARQQCAKQRRHVGNSAIQRPPLPGRRIFSLRQRSTARFVAVNHWIVESCTAFAQSMPQFPRQGTQVRILQSADLYPLHLQAVTRAQC